MTSRPVSSLTSRVKVWEYVSSFSVWYWRQKTIPKHFFDYFLDVEFEGHYYHAIKDSVVYALHANTSDAKYFCGSQTDFGKTSFIKLEDWTADIVKSELVSAEELKERLYKNCEYKLENPKADFYYLVTLNNVKWHGNEIAGTVYKAYENTGNMAASPYSPKIIEIIDWIPDKVWRLIYKYKFIYNSFF